MNNSNIIGYLPQDKPKFFISLILAFQHVLAMFPATVLVAIITEFDVGATLLTSGLGTIISLLASKRKIPMYYGSSFSYISVIISVMSLYSSIEIVQVGILLTGILEIIIGFIIAKAGKDSLDKALPPVITGSMAIVIGIALAGTAIDMSGTNWLASGITLFSMILFSHYLKGKGLIGMLPVLLGAIVGYTFSSLLGLVDYSIIQNAEWFRIPNISFPAFTDPRAWRVGASIALVAIATIPESTAHLYQISLYIDKLALELGRKPLNIKNLIGLNFKVDGLQDVIAGLLGGCPGTNYGENNSLMAITRNYSSYVLILAGAISVALAFIGKLSALIYSIPTAVTGGLAIYLFGVIGMQGIALLMSEKVNLYEPKQLAVGAVILILGIGGNLALPNGIFPFQIPIFFPDGIPAIVFASIAGILLNFLLIERGQNSGE